MKEFFDTRIEDLDLPIRDKHGLIRGGINTVNDLFKFCDYKFIKGPNARDRIHMIRNIGKTGAENIINNINSKKTEGVYLGMPMEELEIFKQVNYSKEELEKYNIEKQTIILKEKQDINRRIFLSTPLEKIDMLSPQMSEVIEIYKIKTLKDLLWLKKRIYNSGRPYSDYDIAKIDYAINNLNIPNISTYMSYEDVTTMCVTDEMLKLLEALIEKNSVLKNESTLKRADNIREETRKKVSLEIGKLKEQVKSKEEAVKKLEELVLEKEKLIDLNTKLDNRIEELLKRINYGKQKKY